MKKAFLLVVTTVLSILPACSQNNPEMDYTTQITITVNGTTFDAVLADSETGRAFAELLPLTITMNELNGNEKYHYLDGSLPTDSYQPGTIEAGDILLYSSSCVVLFYETFSSGYSYTRIGKLTSVDGLKTALGMGNVSVTFAKKQTTGISEVNAHAKANKILRNGQVFIERNGETYNMEGKRL
ncbi:MAG: hypothetical protein IJ776_01975 [Paludibacteraceae bacterium]|nr:hypothetical protein [Paludibacteraceae bacterium]